MLLEGPENALITKLIRDVLAMEGPAYSRSSVVAAPGLIISNVVRDLGSLLSMGMIGFQNS